MKGVGIITTIWAYFHKKQIQDLIPNKERILQLSHDIQSRWITILFVIIVDILTYLLS